MMRASHLGQPRGTLGQFKRVNVLYANVVHMP